MKQISLFLLSIILVGCNAGPDPIAFGEDHCDYCKMGIVDPKFGGEVVTQKGRVYKFDAIECLLPYLEENQEMEIKGTYALPFDAPGKLVSVDCLYFQQSPRFKSPMGGQLGALKQMDPSEQESDYWNWKELKANLKEQ
ncbi:hypothetical protein QWY93_15290 [Echinicola jeungdonensis]|uniref:Copper chaperone NosL n=1 Tax=Echinicola jeungdonensis TaxID=709343 RepID=A0ABV5J4V2_9BACT|nr:hypothetical protein [Echinicola jeungdonensis]MDN3670687.1 hypothetical protein [Echinicola jeungdonensis]